MQVNEKLFLKGDEAVALIKVAKHAQIKGACRNVWEQDFVKGVNQQVSAKGWLSFKQADTIRNFAARVGLIAARADKHVEDVQEMGAAFKAAADKLEAGEQLGAGAFRAGFVLRQTKNLIVKVPHGKTGEAHCAFEANLFKTAGAYSSVLAPCWSENGKLYMFKVDDYVDCGTFTMVDNTTYRHSRNGRTISAENYNMLMAACNNLRNYDGNPFWDCAPNRRTQGGWIGGWFVMTDYAL